MTQSSTDPAVPIWPREAEPWHVSPDYKFTGRTEVHQVFKALGLSTLQVNALWFEEGVRSRPHMHDSDQLLYFFEGPGIVAIDGGPDVQVEVGQFVRLPANTLHMHGAAPGHTAAHISMMPPVHDNTFCPPDLPPAWEQYRCPEGSES